MVIYLSKGIMLTKNSSEHTVMPSRTGSGLLTIEDRTIIFSLLYYFVWPFLISIGLFGNLTNIVIFIKMGLRDGVTISFWALSFSDLLFLLFTTIRAVCGILGIQPGYQDLPVNIWHLTGYFSWYEGMFLDLSMAVTTFIAIVRCCCVAMPFRFKNVFTVDRTIFTLSFITVACVVSRIPGLTTFRLIWQTDLQTNTTKLQIWRSSMYDNWYTINDIFFRTVYPNVVLITVIACSIVLTRVLIKASRSRQAMMAKPSSTPKGVEETPRSKKDMKTLSPKDIQVVKSVTLVAGFLIVNVFIMSVIAIAQVIVPQFKPGGRYRNLNTVTSSIEVAFSHLNASVNIFIYLKFNSKFRTCFQTCLLEQKCGFN